MAGGKLIVFSAPSGSGKTTIVQYLLKQEKLKSRFFDFCNFKRTQKRRDSRPRILFYKFEAI